MDQNWDDCLSYRSGGPIDHLTLPFSEPCRLHDSTRWRACTPAVKKWKIIFTQSDAPQDGASKTYNSDYSAHVKATTLWTAIPRVLMHSSPLLNCQGQLSFHGPYKESPESKHSGFPRVDKGLHQSTSDLLGVDWPQGHRLNVSWTIVGLSVLCWF